jgi:hypothetical protein
MQARFFGGPAHGRVMEVDAPRVSMPDTRLRRVGRFDPSVIADDSPIPVVSYSLRPLTDRRCSPYFERGGRIRRYYVHRSINVMLIDGVDKLLPREHRDIENELATLPWVWDQIPSILDWDHWWRWQLVKRRLDEGWCKCADRLGPWFDVKHDPYMALPGWSLRERSVRN